MSIPYFNASVGASTFLVDVGYTRLWSVIAYNNDGSDEFVQFFDVASTDDVTLGTTTPDFVIPIVGNSATDYEFNDGIIFARGIVFAVTTTPTGSTGPTNPASVSIAHS